MNGTAMILALLEIKGVGPTKVLNFIKAKNFSSSISLHQITQSFNLDRADFVDFYEEAIKEIEDNLKHKIHIISLFDENFPEFLYETKDPVMYLYYKGDISLITKNSIGIIGTRNASDSSIANATKAGKIFGKNNIVVVSGLAIGCDTYAHKGCIQVKGKTIAVLPSGLSNIVPKVNKELSSDILNSGGCLVSEYTFDENVRTYHYPKRDRIQALLSNAILLIEGDETSGSMYAINKAIEENKKIYQIKGNNNKIITDDITLIKNDINNVIEEIKRDKKNKKVGRSNQINLFD